MTGRSRRWRAGLPGLLVAVALGVLAGTSAFAFHYAHATSYLSDDPAVCVNCHVMRPQYDAWLQSSHHAVATCNACHVPHGPVGKWVVKATNGFWHSYYFTFQNFHEPIRLRPASQRVLEGNCRDCHAALVSALVAHDAPGERGTVACVRCHAGVGHAGR